MNPIDTHEHDDRPRKRRNGVMQLYVEADAGNQFFCSKRGIQPTKSQLLPREDDMERFMGLFDNTTNK